VLRGLSCALLPAQGTLRPRRLAVERRRVCIVAWVADNDRDMLRPGIEGGAHLGEIAVLVVNLAEPFIRMVQHPLCDLLGNVQLGQAATLVAAEVAENPSRDGGLTIDNLLQARYSGIRLRPPTVNDEVVLE
jgi:hypothetical protein